MMTQEDRISFTQETPQQTSSNGQASISNKEDSDGDILFLSMSQSRKIRPNRNLKPQNPIPINIQNKNYEVKQETHLKQVSEPHQNSTNINEL